MKIQQMIETTTNESLIGTWKLLSCEARSDCGDVEKVYGDKPFGRLMYGADGHMSVIITESEPRIGASIVCNTPDMISGFLAYCGTYRFVPEIRKITHFVVGSSILSWINSEQVRFFDLNDSKLKIITASYSRNGREWVSTLTWEKLKAA